MWKFLYIFAVISLSITHCSSYKYEVLNNALDNTKKYFETLKVHYASMPLNPKIKEEIDREVFHYIKNASTPAFLRVKRQKSVNLEHIKGIDLLKGFEEDVKLPLYTEDIAFFPLQSDRELLWFAASINSIAISLFQLTAETFVLMKGYKSSNLTSIHIDRYSSGTLLIVERSNGDIVIWKLIIQGNNIALQPAQNLEPLNINHKITWFNMNQLYLAIAADNYISIYKWLDEHFDLVQVLNFGAKKLSSFESKGSMHIVAAGYRTTILRFCLRSNKFILIQYLPTSEDVTTFHMGENRFSEQFLCISDKLSTILYKQVHDRFVPFQKLSPSKKTISMITRGTILLLSLNEGGDVIVYQYDGWRFIRLNIKLSNINNIRHVSLYEKNLLMIHHEKNGWSLEKPIWTQKQSWQSLQNDLQSWCLKAKEKAQRLPQMSQKSEKPLKILKGHIKQLVAHNINGYDTKKLENLTEQYNRIVSQLKILQNSTDYIKSIESYEYSKIHAKNVSVKCKNQCLVNQVVTDTVDKYFSNLRKLDNIYKSLQFQNIKVKSMDIRGCPIPAFALEKVVVNKSINGIYLADLQNNTLKTFGDQEISGTHVLGRLKSASALMSLDITSYSSKQDISADVINVKHLNITQGDILLPLNGTLTIITGSIIAPKVKLTGIIHLMGHLHGKGVQNPTTKMYGSLELKKDCYLQKVNILNTLNVKDLFKIEGTSLTNFIVNGVLLKDDVPVHLLLSASNTKWMNIIIKHSPNWVTARSNITTIISGRKYVSRNVTLLPKTGTTVQYPLLDVTLCGNIVVLPEVKTSTVTIDYITANNLNSVHCHGSRKLNDTIFGSATSFENVDLTVKHLTGLVTVKNASIPRIDEVDLAEIQELFGKWKEPNILKGPMRVSSLSLTALHVPGFKIPIQPAVKNVVSNGNIYVEMLNNVNVINFIKNIINIESMLAMGNIRFDGGLELRNIHATETPLNIAQVKENYYFNSTIMVDGFRTGNLNLPNNFHYTSPDIARTITVEGSVIMQNEPTIENVNNVNLEKLSHDIWMNNETITLSADYINIKSIELKAKSTPLRGIHISNLGLWSNISQTFLSKSKPQNVQVPSSFRNIHARRIASAKSSVLKTSVSHLNEMLNYSLLKNNSHNIQSSWHFNQLKVSGSLKVDGTVNDLNFLTDVVRHDVQKNVVTGRKTILDLSAQDLSGLNFGDWAKNVLMIEKDSYTKSDNPVIIKGKKVFNDINMRNLSVEGTVSERKISTALRKSSSQNIYGSKIIKGAITAPAISIDGLINDVNLTHVVSQQLKKNNTEQRIGTKIIFQGHLDIVGNLTTDGLYQGVDLKKFGKEERMLKPVARQIFEIAEIANEIDIALGSRAVYIHRLEPVDNHSMYFAKNEINKQSLDFDNIGTCKVENTSVYCNDNELLSLNLDNRSVLVMYKIISFRNVPFIVYATTTSLSIYSINHMQKKVYQVTDLYILNIIQASTEATNDSLWIVLRLTQEMIIFRYQLWGELQHYVLPGSSQFTLSEAPNNQLVLTRFDGIWNLDGIARPRHSLKASLNGTIETYPSGADFYIKLANANDTSLFKIRYVGY